MIKINKKSKKFLTYPIIASILIACFLAFMVGPVYSEADYNETIDHIRYTVENNSITIVGLSDGFNPNLVIPDKIDGKYVTKFKNNAFAEKELQSADLSACSQVTEIPDTLFYNCSGLTTVLIPEGIKSVGWKSFFGCEELQYVSTTPDVQYLNIPNLKTIGSSAFGGNSNRGYCASLLFKNNTLTLPEGFIAFETYTDPSNDQTYGGAFLNCKNLKGVDLSNCNNITELPLETFYACDSLETVILPDSLTTIGANCFANCKKLTGLYGPGESYSSTCYPPSKVVTIGDNAFAATGFAYADFSRIKMSSVSDTLFWRCPNLRQAVLSSNTTEIGWKSFFHCESLKWVSTDVSKKFFYTPNLETLGGSAFEGCSSLLFNNGKLTLPSGFKEFKNIDKDGQVSGAAFEKCEKLIEVDLSNCNNITELPFETFYGCTVLKKVIVPDSLKSIGESCFAACGNLTELNNLSEDTHSTTCFPPASITTIGPNAFAATGFTYADFSRIKMSSVPDTLFWRCPNLRQAVLSSNTTEVGLKGFFYCESLKWVSINSDNKYFYIPNLKVLGSSAFEGCSKLTFQSKTLTLPKSFEQFKTNTTNSNTYGSAFTGCLGIEKLDLSLCCNYQTGKLTEIPSYTFSDCKNLNWITWDTYSYDSNFWGKTSTKLTTIGKSAFSQCFQNNEKYNTTKTVTINGSQKEVYVYKDTFSSPKTEVILNLPNSINSIERGAFYQCKLVNRVSLPNKIKVISRDAFTGSQAIALNIPASVETIEGGAFELWDQALELTFGSASAPSKLKNYNYGNYGPGANGIPPISGNDFKSIKMNGSTGTYGKIGSSSVNLRKSYSTNSNIIVTLAPNTTFEYLETYKYNTNWYHVKVTSGTYKNQEGYVYSDFVGRDTSQNNAFDENLDSAKSHGSNGYFRVIDGVLYRTTSNYKTCISICLYASQNAFKDFKVYSSVTRIENYAFKDAINLESIHIPIDITYMGESAFKHADNLKHIYFYDKNGDMGNSNVISSLLTKIADNLFKLGGINSYGGVQSDSTNPSLQNGSFYKDIVFGNSGLLEQYYNSQGLKINLNLNPGKTPLIDLASYMQGYAETWDDTKYNNISNDSYLYKSSKWTNDEKTTAQTEINFDYAQATKKYDFFFVYDYSGSMEAFMSEADVFTKNLITYQYVSKISEAVLKDSSGKATGNRVAVIPFSSAADTHERNDAWKKTVNNSAEPYLTTNSNTVKTYLGNSYTKNTSLTNYDYALDTVYSLIKNRNDKSRSPVVIFVSDGKPSSSYTGTLDAPVEQESGCDLSYDHFTNKYYNNFKKNNIAVKGLLIDTVDDNRIMGAVCGDKNNVAKGNDQQSVSQAFVDIAESLLGTVTLKDAVNTDKFDITGLRYKTRDSLGNETSDWNEINIDPNENINASKYINNGNITIPFDVTKSIGKICSVQLDLSLKQINSVGSINTNASNATITSNTNSSTTINNNVESPVLHRSELIVNKTNSVGVGLSGAKFQIKDSRGNVVNFVKQDSKYLYTSDTTDSATEIISDSNGQSFVYALPVGSYSVQEIEAPVNYQITTSIKKFTIESKESVSVKFIDNAKQGKIKLVKAIEGLGNKAGKTEIFNVLNGVEFSVTGKTVEGKNYSETYTIENDGTWNYDFSMGYCWVYKTIDVDYGRYRVEECQGSNKNIDISSVKTSIDSILKAEHSEGYTTFLTEDVKQEKVVSFYFLNKLKTQNITINKTINGLSPYKDANGKLVLNDNLLLGGTQFTVSGKTIAGTTYNQTITLPVEHSAINDIDGWKYSTYNNKYYLYKTISVPYGSYKVTETPNLLCDPNQTYVATNLKTLMSNTILKKGLVCEQTSLAGNDFNCFFKNTIVTKVVLKKSSDDGFVRDIKFSLFPSSEVDKNLIGTFEGYTDETGNLVFDNIPVFSAEGISKSISYTLTEENISNKYDANKIEFTLNGSTSYGNSFTFNAYNDLNSLGSTININIKNILKTGVLNITKTSDDDVVEGFSFRVTQLLNSVSTGKSEIITTDKNGIASLSKLDGKDLPVYDSATDSIYKYKVEEINVPVRYSDFTYSTNKNSVNNINTSELSLMDGNYTANFYVHNTLDLGNINIYKKSSDNIVSGVSFIVECFNSISDTTPIKTYYSNKTDSDGYVSVPDLPIYNKNNIPYVYKVTEKDMADRYDCAYYSNAGFKFDNNGEQYLSDISTNNNMYVFNKVKIGLLNIEKVDMSDTTKKLDGAIFNIIDSNNSILNFTYDENSNTYSWTDDTKETTSIKGNSKVVLPFGQYTVKEIVAPENYLISTDSLVTIINNVPSTLTFKDEKIASGLVITKQDSQTNIGLSNAKFKVVNSSNVTSRFTLIENGGAVGNHYKYDENGTLSSVTSNGYGKIYITGLPVGNYKVTETSAPTNYTIDDTSAKTVSIVKDITSSVAFKDTLKTSTIAVVKYSQEATKENSLSIFKGTTFEIQGTTSNGQPYQKEIKIDGTWEGCSNTIFYGLRKTISVPYGNYTVTEVSSPYYDISKCNAVTLGNINPGIISNNNFKNSLNQSVSSSSTVSYCFFNRAKTKDITINKLVEGVATEENATNVLKNTVFDITGTTFAGKNIDKETIKITSSSISDGTWKFKTTTYNGISYTYLSYTGSNVLGTYTVTETTSPNCDLTKTRVGTSISNVLNNTERSTTLTQDIDVNNHFYFCNAIKNSNIYLCKTSNLFTSDNTDFWENSFISQKTEMQRRLYNLIFTVSGETITGEKIEQAYTISSDWDLETTNDKNTNLGYKYLYTTLNLPLGSYNITENSGRNTKCDPSNSFAQFGISKEDAFTSFASGNSVSYSTSLNPDNDEYVAFLNTLKTKTVKIAKFVDGLTSAEDAHKILNGTTINVSASFADFNKSKSLVIDDSWKFATETVNNIDYGYLYTEETIELGSITVNETKVSDYCISIDVAQISSSVEKALSAEKSPTYSVDCNTETASNNIYIYNKLKTGSIRVGKFANDLPSTISDEDAFNYLNGLNFSISGTSDAGVNVTKSFNIDSSWTVDTYGSYKYFYKDVIVPTGTYSITENIGTNLHYNSLKVTYQTSIESVISSALRSSGNVCSNLNVTKDNLRECYFFNQQRTLIHYINKMSDVLINENATREKALELLAGTTFNISGTTVDGQKYEYTDTIDNSWHFSTKVLGQDQTTYGYLWNSKTIPQGTYTVTEVDSPAFDMSQTKVETSLTRVLDSTKCGTSIVRNLSKESYTTGSTCFYNTPSKANIRLYKTSDYSQSYLGDSIIYSSLKGLSFDVSCITQYGTVYTDNIPIDDSWQISSYNGYKYLYKDIQVPSGECTITENAGTNIYYDLDKTTHQNTPSNISKNPILGSSYTQTISNLVGTNEFTFFNKLKTKNILIGALGDGVYSVDKAKEVFNGASFLITGTTINGVNITPITVQLSGENGTAKTFTASGKTYGYLYENPAIVLPQGVYTITETSVNFPYDLTQTRHSWGASASLPSNSNSILGASYKKTVTDKTSTAETFNFYYYNVFKKGNLTVNKINNETMKPLPGVEFEMYDQDTLMTFKQTDASTAAIPVYELSADGNSTLSVGTSGSFKINNLDCKSYSLKEIKTPNGFKIKDSLISVELDSEENTVNVYNDIDYRTVRIGKFSDVFKQDTSEEVILDSLKALSLTISGTSVSGSSYSNTFAFADNSYNWKFAIDETSGLKYIYADILIPTGSYTITENFGSNTMFAQGKTFAASTIKDITDSSSSKRANTNSLGLKVSDTPTSSIEGVNTEEYFYNTCKKTTIQIFKALNGSISASTMHSILDGTVFNVEGTTLSGNTISETFTIDNNWQFSSTARASYLFSSFSFPAGSYSVTEVSSPNCDMNNVLVGENSSEITSTEGNKFGPFEAIPGSNNNAYFMNTLKTSTVRISKFANNLTEDVADDDVFSYLCGLQFKVNNSYAGGSSSHTYTINKEGNSEDGFWKIGVLDGMKYAYCDVSVSYGTCNITELTGSNKSYTASSPYSSHTQQYDSIISGDWYSGTASGTINISGAETYYATFKNTLKVFTISIYKEVPASSTPYAHAILDGTVFNVSGTSYGGFEFNENYTIDDSWIGAYYTFDDGPHRFLYKKISVPCGVYTTEEIFSPNCDISLTKAGLSRYITSLSSSLSLAYQSATATSSLSYECDTYNATYYNMFINKRKTGTLRIGKFADDVLPGMSNEEVMSTLNGVKFNVYSDYGAVSATGYSSLKSYTINTDTSDDETNGKWNVTTYNNKKYVYCDIVVNSGSYKVYESSSPSKYDVNKTVSSLNLASLFDNSEKIPDRNIVVNVEENNISGCYFYNYCKPSKINLYKYIPVSSSYSGDAIKEFALPLLNGVSFNISGSDMFGVDFTNNYAIDDSWTFECISVGGSYAIYCNKSVSLTPGSYTVSEVTNEIFDVNKVRVSYSYDVALKATPGINKRVINNSIPATTYSCVFINALKSATIRINKFADNLTASKTDSEVFGSLNGLQFVVSGYDLLNQSFNKTYSITTANDNPDYTWHTAVYNGTYRYAYCDIVVPYGGNYSVTEKKGSNTVYYDGSNISASSSFKELFSSLNTNTNNKVSSIVVDADNQLNNACFFNREIKTKIRLVKTIPGMVSYSFIHEALDGTTFNLSGSGYDTINVNNNYKIDSSWTYSSCYINSQLYYYLYKDVSVPLGKYSVRETYSPNCDLSLTKSYASSKYFASSYSEEFINTLVPSTSVNIECSTTSYTHVVFVNRAKNSTLRLTKFAEDISSDISDSEVLDRLKGLYFEVYGYGYDGTNTNTKNTKYEITDDGKWKVASYGNYKYAYYDIPVVSGIYTVKEYRNDNTRYNVSNNTTFCQTNIDDLLDVNTRKNGYRLENFTIKPDTINNCCFYNTCFDASIKISKFIEDKTGVTAEALHKYLDDTEFRIKGTSLNGEAIDKTVTIDNSWTKTTEVSASSIKYSGFIKYVSIPIGTYTVTEVSSPLCDVSKAHAGESVDKALSLAASNNIDVMATTPLKSCPATFVNQFKTVPLRICKFADNITSETTNAEALSVLSGIKFTVKSSLLSATPSSHTYTINMSGNDNDGYWTIASYNGYKYAYCDVNVPVGGALVTEDLASNKVYDSMKTSVATSLEDIVNPDKRKLQNGCYSDEFSLTPMACFYNVEKIVPVRIAKTVGSVSSAETAHKILNGTVFEIKGYSNANKLITISTVIDGAWQAETTIQNGKEITYLYKDLDMPAGKYTFTEKVSPLCDINLTKVSYDYLSASKATASSSFIKSVSSSNISNNTVFFINTLKSSNLRIGKFADDIFDTTSDADVISKLSDVNFEISGTTLTEEKYSQKYIVSDDWTISSSNGRKYVYKDITVPYGTYTVTETSSRYDMTKTVYYNTINGLFDESSQKHGTLYTFDNSNGSENSCYFYNTPKLTNLTLTKGIEGQLTDIELYKVLSGTIFEIKGTSYNGENISKIITIGDVAQSWTVSHDSYYASGKTTYESQITTIISLPAGSYTISEISSPCCDIKKVQLGNDYKSIKNGEGVQSSVASFNTLFKDSSSVFFLNTIRTSTIRIGKFTEDGFASTGKSTIISNLNNYYFNVEGSSVNKETLNKKYYPDNSWSEATLNGYKYIYKDIEVPLGTYTVTEATVDNPVHYDLNKTVYQTNINNILNASKQTKGTTCPASTYGTMNNSSECYFFNYVSPAKTKIQKTAENITDEASAHELLDGTIFEISCVSSITGKEESKTVTIDSSWKFATTTYNSKTYGYLYNSFDTCPGQCSVTELDSPYCDISKTSSCGGMDSLSYCIKYHYYPVYSDTAKIGLTPGNASEVSFFNSLNHIRVIKMLNGSGASSSVLHSYLNGSVFKITGTMKDGSTFVNNVTISNSWNYDSTSSIGINFFYLYKDIEVTPGVTNYKIEEVSSPYCDLNKTKTGNDFLSVEFSSNPSTFVEKEYPHPSHVYNFCFANDFGKCNVELYKFATNLPASSSASDVHAALNGTEITVDTPYSTTIKDSFKFTISDSWTYGSMNGYSYLKKTVEVPSGRLRVYESKATSKYDINKSSSGVDISSVLAGTTSRYSYIYVKNNDSTDCYILNTEKPEYSIESISATTPGGNAKGTVTVKVKNGSDSIIGTDVPFECSATDISNGKRVIYSTTVNLSPMEEKELTFDVDYSSVSIEQIKVSAIINAKKYTAEQITTNNTKETTVYPFDFGLNSITIKDKNNKTLDAGAQIPINENFTITPQISYASNIQYVGTDAYIEVFVDNVLLDSIGNNGKLYLQDISNFNFSDTDGVLKAKLPAGSGNYTLNPITLSTGNVLKVSDIKIRINWDTKDKEFNNKNNESSTYYEVIDNLNISITAISPNSDYYAGTDVITTYSVENHSSHKDVTPDHLTAVFKVYDKNNPASPIFITAKEVVIPKAANNYVYFNWTVPENCVNKTLACESWLTFKGLQDVDDSDDDAILEKTVQKLDNSHTEDTKYEKDSSTDINKINAANADLSVSITTFVNKVSDELELYKTKNEADAKYQYKNNSHWEEYTYKNGKFILHSYDVNIDKDVSPSITGDKDHMAAIHENESLQTVLKSGYGFNLNYTPKVNKHSNISGDTLPSDSITSIQVGSCYFPESLFSTVLGKFETLDILGSKFTFANNDKYDTRIHYTPIWYPGTEKEPIDYPVSVEVTQCWTPAGVISSKNTSNNISISGNIYEDWYKQSEK